MREREWPLYLVRARLVSEVSEELIPEFGMVRLVWS